MKNNSMLSFLAAIPAFILCAAVRFIQITGGTDMNTGFLIDENGFLLNFGFYGLLIITFAAVIALSVLDRKRGGAFFTNDIGGMTDAKAVMAGFPLLLAGALAVYEGYAQTQAMTPSGFVIFANFILGAAMAVLGFVILYKKEIGKGLGFSFVIPAVYYTLRGIAVFLDRMVVASVPEYLIECLSIIGFAVFFMLLAKLLCGNEGRLTRISLAAVGVTVAVMSLSNACAVILADIINPNGIGARIMVSSIDAEIATQAMLARGRLGYHMAYIPWTDLAVAVGIVLILTALFIRHKPETRPTEEAVEGIVNTENSDEE